MILQAKCVGSSPVCSMNQKTLADTEFLVFARVFAFLYNLKKYLLRHKNTYKITKMQHEMQHEKQVAAPDTQRRPFLISCRFIPRYCLHIIKRFCGWFVTAKSKNKTTNNIFSVKTSKNQFAFSIKFTLSICANYHILIIPKWKEAI